MTLYLFTNFREVGSDSSEDRPPPAAQSREVAFRYLEGILWNCYERS